jgi:hypothetical protein
LDHLNAHALAYATSILRCRREPKWTGGAQIQAILSEINPHRFGEPAGTLGQIDQARRGARALHQVDSRRRLERT